MKQLAVGLWRRLPAPVRVRAKHIGTKTVRAAKRAMVPVSPAQLRDALGRATDGGTDILLVHSSLSSCGRFTAGPGDVLAAFAEQCGTLSLVTHTYCYPPEYGGLGPVYDAAATPSQNGRLTELFRARTDARRSIHATHSLAVSGPDAAAIIEGHYRNDSPCGEGTPYDRLIRRKASVLLFGVSFASYTFFHTSEFMSGSHAAYEHGTTDRLRVVDEDGVVRVCLSQRQNRAPMRFAEAGDLLVRKGLARSVALGRGSLWYVPDSSKVHDFMVERLKQTPDFLRHACTRELA